MTRMALSGFTGIKDISLFSSDQLNEIAASGGFIVVPNLLTVVCKFDTQ